ncbi:MAG: ATP-binding cassette domain-containing protein [Candidatus Helarchaeota archaeon]
MSIFIETIDLTKEYKLASGETITALKNINLKISRGEIFGIFGRSGAGKTTLIRVLRGVEPFNSGSIIINGITLLPENKTDKLHLYRLKRISSIHLQRNFGLWADTVLHNVMRKLNIIKHNSETVDLPNIESLEYTNMKNKAIDILKLVKLENKANWFVNMLSGGEKQRLVLARQLALAENGLELLLLDEPLTMSDFILRDLILKNVRNTAKQNNITIVISSHNPFVLESICDRIAILDRGSIEKIMNSQNFGEIIWSKIDEINKLKPLLQTHVIISARNIQQVYYHQNLKKAFNLKIDKLEIFEGEILGIVGRSGIGKTVLIRILSGVEMPKNGEVIYHFEKSVNIYDLGYNALDSRIKIGLVHQELDLEYFATVRDLIMSKIGFKNENVISNAKKKAKQLGLKENIIDFIHRLGDLPFSEVKAKLDKLNLDPQVLNDLFPISPLEAYEGQIIPLFNSFGLDKSLLNRKTKELSGGEKIRIAIILQILSKPKILFLDEPFGDIDPYTTNKIINFLIQINKEQNMTIIISTHHYDVLKNCVHRLLLLKEDDKKALTEIDKICDNSDEFNDIIKNLYTYFSRNKLI